MKKIKGDLIELAKEGKFDVIVHGCNCFHTMGSGIAKQIKEEFPEAYEVDKLTYRGDLNKLGTYSSVYCQRSGLDFHIVNAYTQYNYGSGKQVNYDAVREVFKQIKEDFTGLRIAYPAIGAGLAGGDWNIISKIIDEELEDEDHTFVQYEKKRTKPRAVDFHCDDCNFVESKLYMPNENIPDMLLTYCLNCGGILRKRDFKNNCHRSYINDPRC